MNLLHVRDLCHRIRSTTRNSSHFDCFVLNSRGDFSTRLSDIQIDKQASLRDGLRDPHPIRERLLWKTQTEFGGRFDAMRNIYIFLFYCFDLFSNAKSDCRISMRTC